MYYTIYKTVNLINGKMYIGKHATENIGDDYLGSGLLLKKSIRKYGKENFKKEILYVFDNEEEMNRKEIEILNEHILKDDSYYNIAAGGQGGAIVMKPGHPLYESTRQKLKVSQMARREEISKITKENHKLKRVGMYGKKQSENQKRLVSEKLKGIPKNPESVKKQNESLRKTLDDPNYVHPNKGRKASAETLQKMSIALKNRPKKHCAYCGRDLDVGNYARYHGDKCKLKK